MNNNLSLISEALGETQSAIDLVTSIDNAYTQERLEDVIQATLDDVKLAHDALESLYTLMQDRESYNLKHNC